MTRKPICPFCEKEYQVGFLGGGMLLGVDACPTCIDAWLLADSGTEDPEVLAVGERFRQKAKEIRGEKEEDPGVMTMTREEFEAATPRECPICNAPGEKWRPTGVITEKGAQHVRCSGDCLLSAQWTEWQALPRKGDEKLRENVGEMTAAIRITLDEMRKYIKAHVHEFQQDPLLANLRQLESMTKFTGDIVRVDDMKATLDEMQKERDKLSKKVEWLQKQGKKYRLKIKDLGGELHHKNSCLAAVKAERDEALSRVEFAEGAMYSPVTKEGLLKGSQEHGVGSISSVTIGDETVTEGIICPDCGECKTPDGHTCCDKEDCSSSGITGGLRGKVKALRVLAKQRHGFESSYVSEVLNQLADDLDRLEKKVKARDAQAEQAIKETNRLRILYDVCHEGRELDNKRFETLVLRCSECLELMRARYLDEQNEFLVEPCSCTERSEESDPSDDSDDNDIEWRAIDYKTGKEQGKSREREKLLLYLEDRRRVFMENKDPTIRSLSWIYEAVQREVKEGAHEKWAHDHWKRGGK